MRRNSQRNYGQANREKRGKVIRAWRDVERDTSQKLEALMIHLADDQQLPPMRKIPARHKVFILDPQIVKSQFAHGFETGYNFRSAMQSIKAEGEEDRLQASIDLVEVKGRGAKKLIFATLGGNRLMRERIESYRTLGHEGMRGFQGKLPPIEQPMILLGETMQHVPDIEVPTYSGDLPIEDGLTDPTLIGQEMLIGNISTALETHNLTTLQIGRLVIRANK